MFLLASDPSQFPIALDWTSLVLGIIGTVLGLVGLITVPQLIWGGPRIEFEFGEEHTSGIKHLRCDLLNQPELRWLLRKLVRREGIDELMVRAEIRKHPSGELVVGVIELKVDGRERVTLPASLFGLRLNIAAMSSDGDCVAMDDRKTVLPEGEYVCDITALGPIGRAATRRFNVGADHGNFYWKHLR